MREEEKERQRKVGGVRVPTMMRRIEVKVRQREGVREREGGERNGRKKRRERTER